MSARTSRSSSARSTGSRIIYLDSAASSLQPRPVIEAMSRYYETTHANVHRAVYQTAEEATARLRGRPAGRSARFVGAPGGADEIVFTKNTTEAFNLLAKSWGAANLAAGDVVLVSEMEHHANIVPWFRCCADRAGRRGAIHPGRRRLSAGPRRPRRAARRRQAVLGHGMSNVLGTINPIAELASAAHATGR